MLPNNKPMRQGLILIIAMWLLLIGMLILNLTGCASYPAQSKVLKQDTNRYNQQVGR